MRPAADLEDLDDAAAAESVGDSGRMRDFYRQILKLPRFRAVALLILVEAALSAAELLLMLRLGVLLIHGDAFLPIGLLLVLVALARLAISGSISYCREMWRADVVGYVLSRAAENLAGRPDIFADHDLRRELPQAALTTGYLASENVCGYIVETGRQTVQYAAVFATTFFFANWLLGAAQALSLAISLVIVRYTTGRLTALSEREERRRVDLGTLFTNLWGHVVPGNDRSVRVWRNSYRRAFHLYRGRNRASAGYSFLVQMSHIATTYALFAGALLLVFVRGVPAAEQAALVVAIPKFIQLLYLQSTLTAYLTAFGVLRGQFAVLRTAIQSPEARDLRARIHFGDIEIAPLGRGEEATDLLLSRLTCKEREPRRFLVTGRNGAGKTSLLLLLKERLRDSAFFLPATVEGLDQRLGPQSTGQEKIALLRRLLHERTEKVLLLDEWDAHLDQAHVSLADRLIDEAVAAGLAVIETRHRRTGR
ncbi:MAG TPA: ABC transporter ATP-binding protein [Allosphingosinicella sp.]|nr:ABC transporter ATP-binding protein [Allosphingosinicella sp.]